MDPTKKIWECQVIDTTLTISNGYASLPSDYLSLVALGYSHNNDGKIDWFYYRNTNRAKGYRVVSTPSKSSGLSYQLQFFTGYPYTPNILRYQKRLDDFEDIGTEYCVLPGELLFAVAKMLRFEDIMQEQNNIP